jgi:hypothetical protein
VQLPDLLIITDGNELAVFHGERRCRRARGIKRHNHRVHHREIRHLPRAAVESRSDHERRRHHHPND